MEALREPGMIHVKAMCVIVHEGKILATKGIDKVKGLLADSFNYFEDPNEPPLTTWEEVEVAWLEIKNQHNIQLQLEPLLLKRNEGTVGYKLQYEDEKGSMHESSGLYYVKLNQDGKALEFRQWWVPK